MVAALSEHNLTPQFTDPDQLETTLSTRGYAVLTPQSLCALSGAVLDDLLALSDSWNDLPADQYLKDGGHYRYRRHASMALHSGHVKVVPHRAHWQPLSYNALHGGMQRWFEPITADVLSAQAWQKMLLWLAGVASTMDGAQTWYTEAHQFRIDTTDGIGRPTPEGAHRDGVDWVAVFLVNRSNIKGGETRVFQADSAEGQRFTLTAPWSLLLLNDRRVIHETTPIQPAGDYGWRDTLVVTLRANGFLDQAR